MDYALEDLRSVAAHPYCFVSILVLMDYALEDNQLLLHHNDMKEFQSLF
jgi:hypothetical protein